MGRRGPQPTVSDERILRHFALSADPVFVASELSEKFDLSRQQLLNRLDSLETEGLLTSKTVSGRRLFWITDDGRAAAADEA